MKLFSVLFLAASFALVACGDDSSSSSAPADENGSSAKESPKSSSSNGSDKTKYDCTVKDGVKVVYPAGGETFHVGDTITVIYGAKIEDSGFCFKFKVDESDIGVDMLDGSAGPEVGDGKTCYKQEVVLSPDVVEASETAMIRVHPYNRQNKGATSEPFKVKE